MTATLPSELREVFDRFITTEYVTIDGRGQPVAWPVTPYHHAEHGCIDVTTGLGYPKKADDAAANPHVALLFSDPRGSGLSEAPMVLVQGTATVDDADLKANRDRYGRESAVKLPAAQRGQPPKFLRGMFSWYYDRIYVHVRPERVFAWDGGDPAAEPELYDAFPFAVRVPVRPDRAGGVIHIEADALGMPRQPGLACLTVHAHDDAFTWQRNFQVRGDLIEDDDGWKVAPHKVVGGFELPPGSLVSRMRVNAKKVKRFRAIAKEQQAKRRSR